MSTTRRCRVCGFVFSALAAVSTGESIAANTYVVDDDQATVVTLESLDHDGRWASGSNTTWPIGRGLW